MEKDTMIKICADVNALLRRAEASKYTLAPATENEEAWALVQAERRMQAIGKADKVRYILRPFRSLSEKKTRLLTVWYGRNRADRFYADHGFFDTVKVMRRHAEELAKLSGTPAAFDRAVATYYLNEVK